MAWVLVTLVCCVSRLMPCSVFSTKFLLTPVAWALISLVSVWRAGLSLALLSVIYGVDDAVVVSSKLLVVTRRLAGCRSKIA